MKPSNTPKSDHELIADLAFKIYEQDNRPEGMALDHWLRAERALRQLRLSEPPLSAPRPSH